MRMHQSAVYPLTGPKQQYCPRATIFIASVAVGVALLCTQANAQQNQSGSPRANIIVGGINQTVDPPEFNIGVAIENLCPQLIDRGNNPNINQSFQEKDLEQRCTDLIVDANSNVDRTNALRQATADEVASMRTSAIELPAAQLARIGARLSALRTASAHTQIFAINGPGSDPGAPHDIGPVSIKYQTGGAAGDDFSKLGVFVNGTVATGDKDQTQNEAGFDFDAFDVTAGVDYRASDTVFFGVAVGLSEADADLDAAGPDSDSVGGRVDTEGITVTGYGTLYTDSGVYIEGSIGFGENDYETERDYNYIAGTTGGRTPTRVTQTAIGDTEGDQFFAHIGVGKDFNKDAWVINAAGRLDFLDADVDGFTERMSNSTAGVGMPLEIGNQNFESLTSTIGAQASKAISTKKGVVQPFVRAEWIHQFEDDSQNVRARFVFDPFTEGFSQGGRYGATSFDIPTDDPDEDYFRIGGGASAVFAGGKSAFISLDVIVGLDDVSHQMLTGGFRWEIGR